jgi:hypothetical protein
VIESLLEEEPAEEVVFDVAGTEGLASDKDSPSNHFEIFRVGLVRKVSLLSLVMDRWGTVGGPLAARDPACI